MDSILVVGAEDELLAKFLMKLGYQLVNRSPESALPDVLAKEIVDLMVLDSRGGYDCEAMLDLLRTDERTRALPVVCIADRPKLRYNLRERSDDRLEIIEVPYRIGALAGKIATRLRLQKMAGADSNGASLAEMNIMLRDLTDRFQRELEEARRIQQSLLPEKLPCNDRVEVAVLYQPLEEVGGDWYYVHETAGGALGLEVADVTGHGLSAAFVGSMTKLALTAAAREMPGELLTEMNRLMSSQIPQGRFVTMLALRYNPENGELRCARAGNPPAVLCRAATGAVEELAPAGFAVGFFEDSEYEDLITTLEPGDVVAIFTDGVPEAKNRSNEMYGHGRIGTALSQAVFGDGRCTTAAEIISQLVNDFETFCDGRIVKDDLTVVLLRRQK